MAAGDFIPGMVPPVYSWVDQEIPDFTDMNVRVERVLKFLNNPPMVRLRKTTAQSIPNNTQTAVSWDLVEVESQSMWQASQPTRITPSTPGWYVGNAGYSFAANTTGYRELNVFKNGSTTTTMIRVKNLVYPNNAALTVVSRGNLFIEQFNGTTDYIEEFVFQNSGGSLGMVVDIVSRQPDFSLTWLAPL